jgi:hypothetical protein
MKEKFAKLFGALLLVALMLGLVLPFQSAAAQEQIPLTVAPTISATDGAGIGVPVVVTLGTVKDTGTPDPTNPYYTLARSETEGGAKIQLANPLTPTGGMPYTMVYTDTTSIPGKMYWYWVQVCDSASCSAYYGDTGWQAVQGLTTGSTVAASINDGAGKYDKVVVTVSPAAGFGLPSVDGYYQIWRQTQTPTVGALAKLGTTTTVTYNDTTAAGQLMDATAAPTYNYAVDVCGKDKCASNNATPVALLATTTPGQRRVPSGTAPAITATPGENKVNLSWLGSGIPEITKYYGQRSYGSQTIPVSPLSIDALSIPETTASRYAVDDLSAQPGITYTYKLWACVTPGTENCTLVMTQTGAAKAGPIADFKASDGDYKNSAGVLQTGKINLTWTASSDAQISIYRIYRSDDAAGTVNLNITDDVISPVTPSAQMSFVDDTVDWGKTYYYWIKSCIPGSPIVCGSASAVDSGWGAIPKVSGFTIVNAKTGITGSWTAISGSGIYYKGWRGSSSTFSLADGPVTIAATSGTDTSGAAGVSYWYFIQACYSDTRCGLPTDPTPGMKLLP